MKSAKWMVALALMAGMAPWTVARAQEQTAPTGAAAVIPEDQRATDAELDKLFEVMRIRQQMAATATMMPQLIQRQITEQIKEMEKDSPQMASMSAEKRQAAEEITQRYMKRAMTLYTPDEMMADMKAVYRQHLSGPDVEAITAFYSTPAGQHMLDMVPVMMQEFMPKVMGEMQAKMKPLILEMQKELVELNEKK